MKRAVVTYYRCCNCGKPFKEKDRERVFCDACCRIEEDEEQRRVFEEFYKVRVSELKDWGKRVAFLRQFDDLDTRLWGPLEKEEEARRLVAEKMAQSSPSSFSEASSEEASSLESEELIKRARGILEGY